MDSLTVEGLSKSFGGVRALRDVSLSLRAGEIRAICGENGAGKSTLVKLLMGIFMPDAGSIAIDGVRQTMRGPQYAQALGLGLVAQELSLAPRLSVLDNIWLGSTDVPVFHRRATCAVARTMPSKHWAQVIGIWILRSARSASASSSLSKLRG